MAAAHPDIMRGTALKKPHGLFGKVVGKPKHRFFVLKLGAGNVPVLMYYKREEFADRADFLKGVLYFDNPGANITVDKDRKSLLIKDASIGRYDDMQHVVHSLDIEYVTPFPQCIIVTLWPCTRRLKSWRSGTQHFRMFCDPNPKLMQLPPSRACHVFVVAFAVGCCCKDDRLLDVCPIRTRFECSTSQPTRAATSVTFAILLVSAPCSMPPRCRESSLVTLVDGQPPPACFLCVKLLQREVTPRAPSMCEGQYKLEMKRL